MPTCEEGDTCSRTITIVGGTVVAECGKRFHDNEADAVAREARCGECNFNDAEVVINCTLAMDREVNRLDVAISDELARHQEAIAAMSSKRDALL